MSTKAKQKPHYVDNKLFSHSVVEYVEECNKAKEAGTEVPKVTDYIATCFMKISEGLSHRPNFVGIHIGKKWLWMVLKTV